MSNLRHGDYNYVTFALVLFFLSPSILSSRNHHLIQYEGQGYFFVCAHVCIYTHMQRMHIIQNTSSLAIIQYSELMMVLPDIFLPPFDVYVCTISYFSAKYYLTHTRQIDSIEKDPICFCARQKHFFHLFVRSIYIIVLVTSSRVNAQRYC